MNNCKKDYTNIIFIRQVFEMDKKSKKIPAEFSE